MTYYLKHHGIMGQKWGKQNGPPYPLDSDDHSSAEKKAGWRQSLKSKIDNAREKYRIKKELHKDNINAYKTYKKNRGFKNLLIDKATGVTEKNVVKLMDKKKMNVNDSVKQIRKTEGVKTAANYAYSGYKLYKNRKFIATVLKTAINIAGLAYVSSKAYQSYQKHLQKGTLLTQKYEWERAPIDVDWRYVK